MNKLYYFLIIFFSFVATSCSIDKMNLSPNHSIVSRASVTPGRPNDFAQIENIPIYIFLPTAGDDGERLNLVNGDGSWVGLRKDNAYNNKWALTWSSSYGCYKIVPVKGAGPICVMGKNGAEWHDDITVKKNSDEVYYRWQFEKIPSTDNGTYYIKEVRPSTTNKWYLKQRDNQTYEVIANQDKGYLFKCGWCVQPVEQFSLVEINYTLNSGDGATPMPSFMDEFIINNTTDTQQSMNATFGTKASVTSSFNEQRSIQIQVTHSTNVSIPQIVNSQISTTTTSASTWSYGNSETKEDSRSYNFPVTVPPHSKYRATVTVAQYKASVSYTAKYKGQTTGIIITQQGKWNGILVGKIMYDIYDITGTRLIQIQGTPSNRIDLRKYATEK